MLPSMSANTVNTTQRASQSEKIPSNSSTSDAIPFKVTCIVKIITSVPYISIEQVGINHAWIECFQCCKSGRTSLNGTSRACGSSNSASVL